MADQHPDPFLAGERFLEAAQALNLDLRWFWGVPNDAAIGQFSQVLLAIVGSGRTAMLFLSSAPHPKGTWRAFSQRGARIEDRASRAEMQRELLERTALLEHAIPQLTQAAETALTRSTSHGPRADGDLPGIVLAQALLEPPSGPLVEAFVSSGFRRLGDLAYYRKSAIAEGKTSPAQAERWPEGVEVVSLADIRLQGKPGQPNNWQSIGEDGLLKAALEDSYIDTLDCPELCGLRTIDDVLVSHRTVGQMDPRLWWIVCLQGRPAGCVMLTPVRETDSVELVYLGLGPSLRGLGLGRKLMLHAMTSLRAWLKDASTSSEWAGFSLSGGVTLAVDTRNVPAVNLYRSLGFSRTGVRIPLVRSVATCV